RNSAAALAGTVAVAGLAITIALYRAFQQGEVIRHEIEWLPGLGLDLVLRIDGLSWIYCILVMGIGALVVLYARYYMSANDPVPRFFTLLLAFMGAMLGIVISGNLMQLVFFWELTSLFSFLLIGYWYHNANARDGARMALTVTSLGGFCLLFGVIIIGRIVGSYDVDTVLASGEAIRASPYFAPALILILVGVFTKSAQFPFHFWLPHAMAAPTPVSAYLHSATMVKAGIYLMTRLWPVMGGTDIWYYVVSTAGLVTFLLGGFVAIFQNDLKGILAYSTISHLGLITLLLGLSTPAAAVAAVFHTLNHATFKASLFMAAGIIDHETGTRDVRRLSGLYRAMPFTATLALVAAAAMAGVPLVNGFISKEMFLTETLALHTGSLVDRLLPFLATLGSAFGVLYSVRFIHQVFFGPPAVDLPRKPHEPVAWMRLPVELLVLICLVVGIIPARTVGQYLERAVRAVLGDATPDYSLTIWHGVTPALMLSMGALVGGALLYVIFRRYLSASPDQGPAWTGRLKARRVFDLALTGLFGAAGGLLKAFGTKRLQPQMFVLLLVAMAAGVAPFLIAYLRGGAWGFTFGPATPTPVDPVFVLIWAIAAICAVASAYLAKFHRLAALILMGGTGLMSCLTFVWLSAPDLAVTQLLVEVVTTVLLLLGLRWIPKRVEAPELAVKGWRPQFRRARDIALAVATGTGVALLSYAAMTREHPGGIASYFLENSYSGGGGTNVVNVLLVDFRGFDTMGEITVLAIVALTVFALLRRFRPAREMVGAPKQQQRQNAYDDAMADRQVGDTAQDYLYVPRVVMHLMFPILAVFAIYLFLRGHDEPGGGFSAGVTMSIAFILQYMAGGTRWVEERLRVLPVRWVGAGLLIAAFTGIGAWLFGLPFLKSYYEYVEIPILGRIPMSSATVFDLGVFVLVVGATVLMLIALAHQSIRTPRAVSPAKRGADDEELASEGAAD
ncbi:MAG TPA: monovalent cation/H+ antiporter subunit A, partial [Trueperaceae bacterium]|nr:monovalent cation/H+ antiporter subunit A [Trueperaceae bacterium]